MSSSRGRSTSVLLGELAEAELGVAPPHDRRPRTADWTRARRASHLRVRARPSPVGGAFLEPAAVGAPAEAIAAPVERRWAGTDAFAVGTIAVAPAAAAVMAGFGAAVWLIGLTAALLGVALVVMLWRSQPA
jgi:hypothetical protein